MMCGWFFTLGCLAFSTVCSAYPIYGPKRLRTYSPMAYPPIYNGRAPRQYYYDPYSQDVPEMVDMFPEDPLDRFRYYQVPYYFPEAAPYYYDDDADMAEEVEEERMEDPSTPGQQWYKQDGNAKANAYFLQNLILAQMYKDAEGGAYGYPLRDDYEEYIYGEPVVKDKPEDEDVSQLKSLTKDSPKRQQRQQQQKKKPEQKQFPDNTWTEKRANQGQEEVAIPRPAFHQRVHEPSAYDAIKKLLQVQSQQNKRESGSRQPQKRSYIPNEDALVEQLGNLKKSA